MRHAFLPAALLVAACGGAPPGDTTNGAAAPEPGEPDNRIACRVGGAARFERVCAVETADSAAGRVLVIRKPDGGFRRLLATGRGGVAAADGAERVEAVRMSDGRTEVSIGGDRFLLPLAAYRR